MSQILKKQTIDVVLPCFNPGKHWYIELVDFYSQIKEQYQINFILVNDGSDPASLSDQVNYLNGLNITINYISYSKNMGKGYALRQGVLGSKSNFIVYTDIDFPFTNQSTINLINTLVNGEFDVVAGYRDENYYLKSMTFYRKLLSRTFRYFIKNVLRMPVTDTQCGLKGFNEKGKVKFLETTINRYLFDFEFIYASGKDLSIKLGTVQVQLKDGVTFSKIRVKILLQELLNLIWVLIFKKT